MEYTEDQEENDSSSVKALVIECNCSTESDSGFESDIRMRTKSLEATNTKRGLSALVVSGYNSPIISSTKPFSHSEAVTNCDNEIQSEIHKKCHGKVSDTPEKISFTKDAKQHQEGSAHPTIPSPMYSIQAADAYSSMSSIHQYESNDHKETDYLLGSSAQKKMNKGRYHFLSAICCVTVSAMVLLVVGLSLVLLLESIDPGLIDAEIYVNNQDTVLLDFFNTFYYKEIQIRKAQDNQCPHCKVEVYSFYPDNLIVADNYFNVSSGNLTATHDGVLLAPKYYVSGSKIKMFVKFYPAKGQNSSVDFVLFNDLRQYEAYRRGDKINPHQVYPVQVNKMEKSFSLVLMITNTGYYFIGIRPKDAPITFQSSFIVHQVYYSRGDFPPPTCMLDSADSCTVHFTRSSTGDYTDTLKMCVLVYSAPPQEIAKSYYVSLDYDVYRGFWTAYSKTLISLICVFSFVCSLCLSLIASFLCLYKRARKK